jgi:hypothetical protein
MGNNRRKDKKGIKTKGWKIHMAKRKRMDKQAIKQILNDDYRRGTASRIIGEGR